MACKRDRIPLDHENERPSVTTITHKDSVEQRKPDTKGYMAYESI